ncbi:MAG: DUF2156 domain-containing protein [Spirochaetaceae bacterium]|nr:MAG: DUF2156 domain-containing protein [Spirochaetaceae bacterium]
MALPLYPDFAPLDLSMSEDLVPALRSGRRGGVADGVSEFTFAGLYLFRQQYGYQVSMLPSGDPVVTGAKNGEPFFLLPLGLPKDDELLCDLFHLGYLKNLSESDLGDAHERLGPRDCTVEEDRDNSDYLYLAEELATLPGKKFHKKRTHVNGFESTYQHRVVPIDRETIAGAYAVLDAWQEERNEPADYRASREALDLWRELELSGIVVMVDETPVAYALGEPLPRGDSFVVHSEKALTSYRGAYQFVNAAFARVLAQRYRYINREQDLGDEGLRQAKMTYRPTGFVRKFRITAPANRALSDVVATEDRLASEAASATTPSAEPCCCR